MCATVYGWRHQVKATEVTETIREKFEDNLSRM